MITKLQIEGIDNISILVAMKSILTFFLFQILISVLNPIRAQYQLAKMWDKRCGGFSTEIFTCLIATTDSGCLLGGYSLSMASGDKTQDSWGAADFWIVKLGVNGNIKWERDYGGDQWEILNAMQNTKDGGYILGGSSSSGISGNKTEILKDTASGYDYWVLKIDSLGNIQWDKDFGGFDIDNLTSIDTTSDGGYILGGNSRSQANGDKSQDLHDTIPFASHCDFWIIRIDSAGNKLWDKRFGGFESDQLYSVHQTSDKGFICGGYIFSDVSFEVSQPVRDSNNPNIAVKGDYWIIKTDSLGNKQWDKRFGGDSRDEFHSLQISHDKGFVLGGYSLSLAGADKTENNCSSYYTYGDYWVIKTDSLGNKLWDKSIGGFTAEDFFGNVYLTRDNGIMLTGTSYSGISCEKTQNNAGTEQTWAINIDSIGNVIWDRTLLTNVWTSIEDEIGYGIQTNDGCYVIGNHTEAPVGYDVTHHTNGGKDYWVEKFCPNVNAWFTVATNSICPGSCIDFTNLSYNATSYLWSFPGAVPDTSTAMNPSGICFPNPGQYDVQLVAINPYLSDTFSLNQFIHVYPSPSGQAISQSGDTLFANQGAPSYQWYYNGNLIPGATDYFYVAPTSGDYNVVATDSNGCEVEAVINNVAASIQYTVDSRQLIIYPNPVLKELKINNEELIIGTAKAEISIYNAMGEKFKPVVDRRLSTVDCRPLADGIYYLEIISENKIYRAKFLKQ